MDIILILNGMLSLCEFLRYTNQVEKSLFTSLANLAYTDTNSIFHHCSIPCPRSSPPQLLLNSTRLRRHNGMYVVIWIVVSKGGIWGSMVPLQ